MPNKTNQNKFPKWLRICLPAILILIWLTIGSLGGIAFGKINNVVNNQESAFLPKTSQSTKVINDQANFQNTNNLPAILLTTYKHKINFNDLRNENNLLAEIKTIKGVINTKDNAIVGPIIAKNKQAFEIIVPTNTQFDKSSVINQIKNVTKNVNNSNLKFYVTGPAAIVQAFSNAFSGVNGILTYVAVAAVLIILLIVYRSILLPFIVLLTALFSLTLAILVVYNLALHNVVKLNGESQGILSILVIGAATDYSIFIISRFKEGLHKIESTSDSLLYGLTKAWEPILAAASTVIIALLMLLFSQLNSNRSLGPIAAIGIVSAFLGAMTLLPALLATLGRKSFWPYKITIDSNLKSSKPVSMSKFWSHITSLIQARSRMLWLVLSLILIALTVIGLPTLKANGVSQSASILSNSAAVKGQNILGDYFPAGTGSPINIISNSNKSLQIVSYLTKQSQISSVKIFKNSTNASPKIVNGLELISATTNDNPQSNRAFNLVTNLRNNLVKIDPSVLVGGRTATQLDTNNAAKHDLKLIIPLVLIVIFIILILLLRSIVAPILLILSVIISYTATLGVSALVFNHLFHFPGADPSVPLFGFIFLVALGVDYNIFLMTRIKEEAKKNSTKKAVLNGVGITGNVITAAGLVLAATFGALGVIPILFLAQIAFIVSFGVLLDTLIVRTIIVPSICYDLGHLIWWPSKKVD